ncbi:MAG TPA: tRNA (N6-threonylcarbamoyladenosine(37)-N6)-methyltransferase TrmO [Flavisolibacter sp.]|jgi:L-fuculose-phosphate aldolase|nr:tRNA (N6-threonylcarbamoyladenosine(37)-N6)-methyltransferase TrmO [Flavisolibacter sp.]
MNLVAIGVIQAPMNNKEDCPLQEIEGKPGSVLRVLEEFGDAAQNIHKGSELVLLSWLDRSDRSILKTHPRNDPQLPLTGVFSTRSPDRPNPIGIHKVTVLEVLEKNLFVLSGLDLLDQTPIIDIKVAL